MNVPMQVHSDGIARAIVHYAILEDRNWKIACLPDLNVARIEQEMQLRLRSEDPRAVSCLNCLHTTAHREAMARINEKTAGAPICG